MKIPSFALVTVMLMITSLAFAQVPSKPGANLSNISQELGNHVNALFDYQSTNKDENFTRYSIADNANTLCAEVRSMISKLTLLSLITSEENRSKGIKTIKDDIEEANKVTDVLITNTNQDLSSIKNPTGIQNTNDIIKLLKEAKETYVQIESTLK
jgi:ABC-type proline/glycine betaine transport system permease subunit